MLAQKFSNTSGRKAKTESRPQPPRTRGSHPAAGRCHWRAWTPPLTAPPHPRRARPARPRPRRARARQRCRHFGATGAPLAAPAGPQAPAGPRSVRGRRVSRRRARPGPCACVPPQGFASASALASTRASEEPPRRPAHGAGECGRPRAPQRPRPSVPRECTPPSAPPGRRPPPCPVSDPLQ